MGIPFQVKAPHTSNIIKHKAVKNINEEEIDEDLEEDVEEKGPSPEEILENAKKEAEFIVKEAEFEAERILEEIKEQCDEYRAEIERQAMESGYEKGENEAKSQYNDLIKEAEFIREHAKSEYNEVLQSIESDAVEMILDIAKKVINTEISQNKEAILYMVKDAFGNCSNIESVTLKVSSDNYELLVKSKDELISMVEGLDDLEIKKDLSLKSGGCILETPFGTVDAGKDTKFQKIEEAFKLVLGKQVET